MSKTIISVGDLHKEFKLPHEKHRTLKSSIIDFRNRSFERQKVLRGISFDIEEGEFFGVVGRNGSGKSTLLKILAGIYQPTSGNIQVNGSLTPFIELGVGFHSELSGRDNIFLNGAMLGMTRDEVAEVYDKIVEFAELEKFMDQKLKNYSSGMVVRLAFSIAIQAKSNVLLIDEVLAVGDANFQKKCYDYFNQLKKDKRTVVFISHDMSAVREYCDRAVLIEKGEIIKSGDTDKVAQEYTKLFIRTQEDSSKDNNRWGNGKATIEKVVPKIEKNSVNVSVTYKFNQEIEHPVLGIAISSPTGAKIVESNTKWQKVKTGSYKKGDKVTAVWELPNIFTNGSNQITAAVADASASEFFDWWDDAASFMIDKDEVTTGLSLPKHTIKVINEA